MLETLNDRPITQQETAPFTPPTIARRQKVVLGLLVATGVISYVDRATLSVANGMVRHDLGLSASQMGLLLSAFLWAYAIAQLPVGFLIDRIGARKALAFGLTLWSVAQLLGGCVTSLTQFCVVRAVLGLGESPVSPGSSRATRDWFAVHNRGTATGIWNSSSSLGTAVAVPLLTFLMLSLGWRWMFIVMGGAGLIVAALLYSLYRDPRECLTPHDCRHLDDGSQSTASPVTFAQWRRLFGQRTSLAMLVGFFGCIYVLWMFNAWLPYYLEHDRHLSIAHTGMVAAIPFVFGVLGSLFGGWLVDLLVRQGVSPINSRKYPMGLALVGMGLATLLGAMSEDNAIAVASISVAMFLCYVCTAAAWATPPVAVPGPFCASMGAMQNFGGYIGGAIAPSVTGAMLEHADSLRDGLAIGAFIAIVCAVGYFLLMKKPVSMEDLAD